MNIVPRLTDIFPRVTWFKIDMDTLEKAEIKNDCAKYQEHGIEGTVVLPLGWTSHLDENGAFYYTYDKAPFPHTFCYPMPTVRSMQPGSERLWGPILNFKTLRGYLGIGSALSPDEQSDQAYPLHSLSTREGHWAGVIYVHCPPENNNARKVGCELVLMSGGFAHEDGEDQSPWIPEWNSPKGHALETIISSIMFSGSSGRVVLLTREAWVVWCRRFGMICQKMRWKSSWVK